MFADLFGKRREITQHRRLWFFRSIRTHRTDWRFIPFGHVRIRIPQPFDRARGLYEGSRHLALKQTSFLLHRESRGFVQSQLALQSGFLNQQRLPGLLRHQRIPQQRIVLPPRMIRHKVQGLSVKRRRGAVHDSTFILPDGHQLLRARHANRVVHRLRPIREHVLREQHVVMRS